MERSELIRRIESYAETVGQFKDLRINCTRQIRGDIKEIKSHCETNGYNFQEMKEHYINNCRRYFPK